MTSGQSLLLVVNKSKFRSDENYKTKCATYKTSQRKINKSKFTKLKHHTKKKSAVNTWLPLFEETGAVWFRSDDLNLKVKIFIF